MVSLIQTALVFIPYVRYPVQEAFDFVLTFFEALNSCCLNRQIDYTMINWAIN